MSSPAQRAFVTMAEADAERYVRGRDLPKLIAVWPKETFDYSIPGTRHVIKRVQRVLRATYRLALSGHYSYSVNRHIGLLSALKAEQTRLAHLIEERRVACLEAAE
jgi:hypothetical protein